MSDCQICTNFPSSVWFQDDSMNCTCFWKHNWRTVCLCLVVRSCCDFLSGHPRPSRVRAGVPQSPGWPCDKAPTQCRECWSRDVVWSSCSCSWSWSCSGATENTYTPALLEALLELTHSRPLSPSYPFVPFVPFVPFPADTVGFAPKFLRVVGVLFNEILCPMSNLRSHRTCAACCLQCRNPSCSRQHQSVSLREDWSALVALCRWRLS